MVLYVVVFLSSWMGPLSHKVYQLYTTIVNGERTFEIYFQYLDMIGVSLQVCWNLVFFLSERHIFLLFFFCFFFWSKTHF